MLYGTEEMGVRAESVAQCIYFQIHALCSYLPPSLYTRILLAVTLQMLLYCGILGSNSRADERFPHFWL